LDGLAQRRAKPNVAPLLVEYSALHLIRSVLPFSSRKCPDPDQAPFILARGLAVLVAAEAASATDANVMAANVRRTDWNEGIGAFPLGLLVGSRTRQQ
jgi:hypothetical protein